MVVAKYGQRALRKSSLKVNSIQFSARILISFPTGLRSYWESPWATYSRGRSRWRNQFLVDFLQKRAVARTKKQVASHIQVLRNMWKGEPGLCSHYCDVSAFTNFPYSQNSISLLGEKNYSLITDCWPHLSCSATPLASSLWTLKTITFPRSRHPHPLQDLALQSLLLNIPNCRVILRRLHRARVFKLMNCPLLLRRHLRLSPPMAESLP
jgi:hypothetical protein